MATYAPHITSPQEGGIFNLGTVTITWDKNDPPSIDGSISTDYVSYEIEYTDDYKGGETNWHTLRRRIPWSQTSLTWTVGKMIKSESIRIRMRAYSSEDEERSDWSISNTFSINVFNLISPAIVSPLPNILYTDFILIILDESLTVNTYHQKVRYTLEYSSKERDIDWTALISDLPVGQNVIRWNIEDIQSSDDYILKLTARNTSTCLPGVASEPDQIARSFVHNINIQQSGAFLIDTKPPEVVLEIEGNSRVTNQLEQVVNVFADDLTSQVEQVQMRECDAGSILSLGDLEEPETPTTDCPSIEELLSGSPDFDKLITDKPINENAKIQWVFNDASGLKKLEALLTDTGGNTSIQEATKVFLSAFDSDDVISDFLIVVEQRDNIRLDTSTTPPTLVVEPSIFEVVYLGTTTGGLWLLEPFSRLLYTLPGIEIHKLKEFNDLVLIFTYNSSSDTGAVYRNDGTEATLLNSFTAGLSIPTSVAEFDDDLYIGFENGKLWKYSGIAFSEITSIPTTDPISTLHGDEDYLYIGFKNSSDILLYNGTQFFTVSME